jgi:hydroxyethylthiazole kinase-like uncharacterized protein yjeF
LKAELLDWNQAKQWLPRRLRNTNKRDYGHVLVIGGDYGMGGAVRMASEAALRVGAGLVTVVTRAEHVPVVNCARPEIMCYQARDEEELAKLTQRATVIIIGPGLGKSDWAKMLFSAVLSKDIPKVLDADALNLLSLNPAKSENWILTPHPGEAGRLLNKTTFEVQENRFAAIQELQNKYGGTLVLKGSGTLVQTPTTEAKMCPAGNPGMATGGMGDVLSGVIGGLLAQNMSLQHAAECGVLVHSMAADLAAHNGGERGLLATDLMSYLRELVNPFD